MLVLLKDVTHLLLILTHKRLNNKRLSCITPTSTSTRYEVSSLGQSAPFNFRSTASLEYISKVKSYKKNLTETVKKGTDPRLARGCVRAWSFLQPALKCSFANKSRKTSGSEILYRPQLCFLFRCLPTSTWSKLFIRHIEQTHWNFQNFLPRTECFSWSGYWWNK